MIPEIEDRDEVEEEENRKTKRNHTKWKLDRIEHKTSHFTHFIDFGPAAHLYGTFDRIVCVHR